MINLKKMNNVDKEILRDVLLTFIVSAIFTTILFAGIYKKSQEYRNGTVAIESSYGQESSRKSVIVTPQIRITPEGGTSISHTPIIR